MKKKKGKDKEGKAKRSMVIPDHYSTQTCVDEKTGLSYGVLTLIDNDSECDIYLSKLACKMLAEAVLELEKDIQRRNPFPNLLTPLINQCPDYHPCAYQPLRRGRAHERRAAIGDLGDGG